MKVVKVQFHSADKEYYFLPEFTEGGKEIVVGDQVIADTTLGQDIGIVTALADWHSCDKCSGDCASGNCAENKKQNNEDQKSVSDIKPLLRPATTDDLDKAARIKEAYPKYIKKCNELIDRHGLRNMKLVDAAESFDENRLTYYFISDNRVDFRELVKDLVKEYHKKIRLQQIGVRDAAKMEGDFGPCGLPLCCRSWLNEIGNVSPDFVKDQELSHRGADRLTGPCGRLKCCLRFEEEAYKYNLDKLPKIGEQIKTKAGIGRVVSVHALKQTVKIELDGAVVEYPYLEGKLCQKVIEE